METPISILDYELLGVENPEILLLLLPFSLVLVVYILRKGINANRMFFTLTRISMVLLLLMAIAHPYVVKLGQEYTKNTSIVILEDESESMRIFEENERDRLQELHKELEDEIKQITGETDAVEVEKFSEGNRTAIGEALYGHLQKNEKNKALVLFSDGNNNHGVNPADVSRILGNENITVYPFVPEKSEDDVYISQIQGDDKTPVRADYHMSVEVVKTTKQPVQYDLLIRVDNDVVAERNSLTQQEKTKKISFTLSFPSPGVKKVEAVLQTGRNDYYSGNNKYLKPVEVAEKPDVLLLSRYDSSPLKKVLEENYNVIHATEADAISKYSGEYETIYLDDVPENKIHSVTDTLHEYVLDGNGLVVVGGNNSYEHGGYNNTYFESLLPVTSTKEPEQKRQPMAVVFLVDVSSSMGYTSYFDDNTKQYISYLDEGKAIVINMMRQLDANDSIGVLAFNRPVEKVIGLTRIGDNRGLMENAVMKLKPAPEGGTYFLPVLRSAQEILEDYDSEKHVVFMSDGFSFEMKQGGESGIRMILNQIQTMSDKGITVHTVSIGDRTQAKNFEPFMEKAAEEGGGLHFWMEEDERLNAVFEDEEEEERDHYQIGVYDKYHFITEKMPYYTATADKYNGVSPKSIARELLVTQDKAPILSVWRYGLGRVASLSTDNGRRWGLNLYQREDGRLISAMTNWVIGDLEKNKKIRIQTSDIHLGEKASVSVKVKDRLHPSLSATRGYDKQEIGLKQVDVTEYKGTLNPTEKGFIELEASDQGYFDTSAIGVDYPVEYSNLNVNYERMRQIAQASDGILYNTSQKDLLKERLKQYVRESSLTQSRETKDIHMYLLAAALALFFLDTVVRRLHEIVRKKRVENVGQ